MKRELNYVRAVLGNRIIILCTDRKKSEYLRSIGARKKFIFGSEWVIHYSTEIELVDFFIKLRDKNFLFSYDEHGWGPSDVFRYFREKGLLQGYFDEIYWVGPNKHRVMEGQ